MNEAGQVIGFDGSGHGFLLAPDGKRTDLGVLQGDNATLPLAINASGVIVGYGEGPQWRHAALWTGGKWAVIPSVNAWSVATGIDDAGDVVGFASTGPKTDSKSASPERPPMFAFFAGVRESSAVLPPAGGKSAFAVAVSPSGRIIAGSTESAAGDTHAFLYEAGAMKDLGTLGGKESNAYGVNDRGDVVGVSSFLSIVDPNPGSRGHAFLYANGAMTDLGTLGGDRSDARSINAAGVVVGNSTVADGSIHPFVYRDGSMTDLLPKDSTGKPFAMARAEHVTDNGTILGWGVSEESHSDGAMTRCLSWTPSP